MWQLFSEKLLISSHLLSFFSLTVNTLQVFDKQPKNMATIRIKRMNEYSNLMRDYKVFIDGQ